MCKQVFPIALDIIDLSKQTKNMVLGTKFEHTLVSSFLILVLDLKLCTVGVSGLVTD